MGFICSGVMAQPYPDGFFFWLLLYAFLIAGGIMGGLVLIVRWFEKRRP